MFINVNAGLVVENFGLDRQPKAGEITIPVSPAGGEAPLRQSWIILADVVRL